MPHYALLTFGTVFALGACALGGSPACAQGSGSSSTQIVRPKFVPLSGSELRLTMPNGAGGGKGTVAPSRNPLRRGYLVVTKTKNWGRGKTLDPGSPAYSTTTKFFAPGTGLRLSTPLDGQPQDTAKPDEGHALFQSSLGRPSFSGPLTAPTATSTPLARPRSRKPRSRVTIIPGPAAKPSAP